MNYLHFIHKIVKARIDAGKALDITPDEAVDIFQRTGELTREVEWFETCPTPDRRFIFMVGVAFTNVPKGWTLDELLPNFEYAMKNDRAVVVWNEYKKVLI